MTTDIARLHALSVRLAPKAGMLFDSMALEPRVAERAMRVAHRLEQTPLTADGVEDAKLFLNSLLFVIDDLSPSEQDALTEACFLAEMLVHHTV